MDCKQSPEILWHSGVLSSATYGLLATGVTYTSKRSLQAMTARQTRAIPRRPAQVRTILHAEDPFVALTRQGDTLLSKLDKIAREKPQDRRGLDLAREQLQHVLTILQRRRKRRQRNTSVNIAKKASHQ